MSKKIETALASLTQSLELFRKANAALSLQLEQDANWIAKQAK